MELVKRVNEALTSHFPLGESVDLRCQSVDVTVEQNEILALRRALAGELRNCRPCRAHRPRLACLMCAGRRSSGAEWCRRLSDDESFFLSF